MTCVPRDISDFQLDDVAIQRKTTTVDIRCGFENGHAERLLRT